jgi:hypothetical protein
MREGSPQRQGFVLEEPPIDGIVDPRGAREEPLAAVGRDDLNPRLSLVSESIGPGACRAVRDDGPERVVFPGGRGDRKKIPIASE